MTEIRNITLEEIDVQEGNQMCSYDAEIQIQYSIEDCECDTHRGVRTWEEVDIEDIFLVSFDKYKETEDDYGGVMWKQTKEDMPKESWEFLKQKVIDDSSEYILEH